MYLYATQSEIMDTYKETHATWNKVAAAYEASFMDLAIYNDTYDAFLELLPYKNAAILDVGCGPGNISKYLVSQNTGLQIHGVDVSESMIQKAKLHVPSGVFQVLDVRNLATLKLSFEGVICGFCLPYLSPEDCETFIKTCTTLLAPKGIVYLSFVEGTPNTSGFIKGSTGDRVYFYYHSLDSIHKLLTKHRLTVEETLYKEYKNKEGLKETHTIILAKKD